ncbi:MAG: transposase [Candidatus Omnitrophota bacterium]
MKDNMPARKEKIVNGEVHHVFSRSIAGYEIFREDLEYNRMKDLLWYYSTEKPSIRFSDFLEIKNKENIRKKIKVSNDKIVDVLAFCFMPTHIHVVLKQLKEEGISIFMSRILNSYTRYFNVKTKRKGPLWESRFKNVAVQNDEQWHHLTRYLHLNPVTARLVDSPENWKYSSYEDFLQKESSQYISKQDDLEYMEPNRYKDFVNSQIDYQRQLAIIKNLCLEN